MPLGFGIALERNPAAKNRFAQMTIAEQEAVISRTHSISSKRAMEEFVQTILS